jgi:hypothetical protein
MKSAIVASVVLFVLLDDGCTAMLADGLLSAIVPLSTVPRSLPGVNLPRRALQRSAI